MSEGYTAETDNINHVGKSQLPATHAGALYYVHRDVWILETRPKVRVCWFPPSSFAISMVCMLRTWK